MLVLVHLFFSLLFPSCLSLLLFFAPTFYFLFPFPPLSWLSRSAEKSEYLEMWKQTDAANEFKSAIDGVMASPDAVLAKLETCNIFTIAKRSPGNAELCYVSCKFTNNIVVLGELAMTRGDPVVQVSLSSSMQILMDYDSPMSTFLLPKLVLFPFLKI